MADFHVIGLAGGIGAGKSSIAQAFGELGAVVVDADAIVHRMLETADVAERLSKEFGEDIIENGAVSRSALSQMVFQDRELVERLNSILHPAVIEECRRRIDRARRDGAPAVVLDAPLLFEAGLDGLCDAVVFVEAPREVRLSRLERSRGWGADEVSRREKFQDSLKSKRERADYIIDNSGSKQHAAEQAADIRRRIRS